MITLQIDISNGFISPSDLKTSFKILHSIIPEIPEDYTKIGSANNNDSEKDKRIKELEERLKTCEEEKKKELDNIQKQLDEKNKNSQLIQKELEQKDTLIETLQGEKEAVLSNQEKLEQEIKRLNNENTELSEQVKNLKNKISIYDPSYSSDHNEKKYFNIEGMQLIETMSDDAPIISNVYADGKAKFQFNFEKGPHKYMSQNKATLENFFEITKEFEGANHISIVEWGEARYQNGILTVDTKAKINLTRD